MLLEKHKMSVWCHISNNYMSFAFATVLLLLLSGELKQSPGPPNDKLKSLSACHVNICSLNESEMNRIQRDLHLFRIIVNNHAVVDIFE